MLRSNRAIAWSAIVVVAALLVVGVVSREIVRHVLQTAPVWIAVTLAWRGGRLAKWAAVPVFVFWFVIMALIWLFLLGIARIASGTYSPTEIAMTVVVGLACLVGLVACARNRARTPLGPSLAVLVAVGALQVSAMVVSLRAPISGDAAILAWIRHAVG